MPLERTRMPVKACLGILWYIYRVKHETDLNEASDAFKGHMCI